MPDEVLTLETPTGTETLQGQWTAVLLSGNEFQVTEMSSLFEKISILLKDSLQRDRK